MKNILEVSHLTKRFDDSLAIDDISLSIKSGSSLGLVGLNGSGKSTLLKLILNIFERDAGDIKVFSERISSINKPGLNQVGSLIEYPRLFPEMTCLDHLRLHVKVAEPEKAIRRIIDEMQLTDFIDRPVDTISFAMKQKLGIAQALVNQAPLILLDEPATGLNVQDVENLNQVILQRMNEGTSFLITGVHVHELQPLVSDVVFLHDGKVIQRLTYPEHPQVVMETSDDILARAILQHSPTIVGDLEQLIIAPTDDFSLMQTVELLTSAGVNIHRLETLQ